MNSCIYDWDKWTWYTNLTSAFKFSHTDWERQNSQYLSEKIYWVRLFLFRWTDFHSSRILCYEISKGGCLFEIGSKQILWSKFCHVLTEICILYMFGVQSCPVLCDPMDCSPPGSSVHGIFQAEILEWISISFSKGSSQPRNQTQVSSIAGIHRQILYGLSYEESPMYCIRGQKIHRGCVTWPRSHD